MENHAKFALFLAFILTFSLSAILILKPTSGGHWVSCCESGCDFGNCGTTMVDSTTYYCTYDGSTWAWRTNPPNEVCNDGIDNDCDQEVDCNDTDCSSNPACDTTAPTGSVSHSPSSPTDQDQVTFTAKGSDSGSGLDKIEIYVDNNLKKTCNFNGETTEQSCSYTGGPYSAGSSHSYYAKFYDIAGNVYTTSSESFTVSSGGFEVCDDGIDNDGDGKVDCDDPDCYGKKGPTGAICCLSESGRNASVCVKDTDSGDKPLTKGTCYWGYCSATTNECTYTSSDSDECSPVGLKEWYGIYDAENNMAKCNYKFYDCDDYDCSTGLASTCSINGNSLERTGDDYGCSDGACKVIGTKTCESYTCDSNTLCSSQTCAETTYYCYYDNGYKWGTSYPSSETNCNDRIDNDCDGKVDSNDPDCQGGAGSCCTQNGPASDKSTECVNNNCGDYPKCYNYRCYSASIEDYSFDKTTVAPGESITLTATIKNTGCNISSEQFAIVGDWHYCGSDGVCGNGDDAYKYNYEEGNYVSISKGSTGTSSVTWSIPSGWSEGKYKVVFWVLSKTIKESCGSECGTYDWDKRVSIAKTKEINIKQLQADTTAPTTTINPNGKDWTNSDVSFTLSCSDSGSGCQETKYSIIDASNSCPSYNSLSKTGTSGTVSCSANSVCQKAVCYASKDKAGNVESVHKSNAFKIDKKNPSTTATITDQGGNNYQITLSCSDSGSGCDKTYYCTDTSNSCPPSNVYSGSFTTSCSGCCYVRFYSKDNAGNVENIKSESFGPTCGCTRANPSVSISPSSQSGNPGDTLTYTVTVTNNDNSACGSSTFDLSVINCPSGWTCSLADNSLTISSGSSKSTTISVTSSSSASSNTYVITVKAENSADTTYYGSEDLEYKVVPNTYTLTVYTQIDVLGTNLDGVKVTIDGNDYYSSNGKITVQLTSGSHTIKAYNLADRDFSHFYDHDANADCNQNDPHDTATNPYTFTMNSCDRDITIWYKVKTKIENLNYDGSKIAGKLLMENDNPIPSRFSDDHRKVKLYYSTDNGGCCWNLLNSSRGDCAAVGTIYGQYLCVP